MTDVHDVYREWDAAYLLGALSPEERRAFERHLNDCTRCSAAVTELAGMPGLLGLLSAADADAAADTGSVGGGLAPRHDVHEGATIQRLAAAVRVERQRTRRLVAGATVLVAGLLVTAGIVLGATVVAPSAGDSFPSADVFEMTPLASGALTADLEVTPKKWGTLLAWDCQYEDPPWTDPAGDPVDLPEYALIVTQTDGTEIVVATWRGAGERARGLSAATSIPTDDIAKVEIRTLPEMLALARATL